MSGTVLCNSGGNSQPALFAALDALEAAVTTLHSKVDDLDKRLECVRGGAAPVPDVTDGPKAAAPSPVVSRLGTLTNVINNSSDMITRLLAEIEL